MFDCCQEFFKPSLQKFPDWPAAHFGRWAGTTLLCGILMACGGGGGSAEAPPTPSDPLAAFTQQQLDWKACDAQRIGAEVKQVIALMPQRVRCAPMRVPLDYDNPGQGELEIELLRVSATQPQRRLGSIVLNPGGPGVDGLDMALFVAAKLALTGAGSFSGMQLREMSNRYDLIGFSPRGTGVSKPLVCDVLGSFEEQDSLTFNRSAENLQRAQRNARLTVQSCLSNPLSRHIHTEATARDMDLIRALQGDAQLNYLGYSYGTWLGSWYARLFPQRVGRMLLDSSVDIGARYDDQLMQQEMGRQRILDEIMLPYAERHHDQLALGSAATLRASLLGMTPSLKEALFGKVNFTQSPQIERSVLSMGAAVGLNTLLREHPNVQGAALKALVQSHVFSPLPQINAAVVPLALELIAAQEADNNEAIKRNLVEVDAQGAVRLLPTLTVNLSVRCNDTGAQGDEQYWLDLSNDYVARYPMVGGGGVLQPCLYWTTRPRTLPPLPAGLQALILQSRYDGSTPVEGALATLALLPNARMIVVENEYTHGVFPYGTECVDAQVAAYFLQGALPPRTSSCAGKPLAGEAGSALRTLSASTDHGLSQAQNLLARFQGRIDKTGRQDF